jgi:hypothetical protein
LKTEVNDLYNKLNQKYEILGRFFITGKEYCRVKFTTTKHEDVVPADRINNGDFEDTSIVSPVFNKEIKKEVVEKINSAPLSEIVIDDSINLDKGEVYESTAITAGTISASQLEDDSEPVDSKIIATSHKGEEIEVEDLEAFCEENKLDIEVVNAVLEGKQKTHRKWRFTRG